MAGENRIELVIEGIAEGQGKLKFNVFMSQLQNFAAVLAKIDKLAHDGSASLFEVSWLSFNSPYRIGVDVIAKPAHPQAVEGVLSQLTDLASALHDQSRIAEIDFGILEDIYELAKPIGKGIRRTSIVFGGSALEIDSDMAAAVTAAMRVEEECLGSVTGMLEQINVHGNANTFQIFPVVGPTKVSCHFAANLYDDAVAGVGRKVEVSGVLRYRPGAKYPHEVAAQNIEIIEREEDLPDWDDIRGRAPDATGDLSSEEFIRELRDAW